DLGDHVLEPLEFGLAPLLQGLGTASLVLEDAIGRAQQLLLPAVDLDRAEALAAAEVGDLDARLHPGQDDPEFLGGAPLPPRPVVAHRWSSRSSSSYPWRRPAPNLPAVPLVMTHYTGRPWSAAEIAPRLCRGRPRQENNCPDLSRLSLAFIQ